MSDKDITQGLEKLNASVAALSQHWGTAFTGLSDKLDKYTQRTEASIDLVREELRTLNETVAVTLGNFNVINRRLDDHDRRIRDLERERRDTEPAPPAPNEDHSSE